MSLDSQMLYEWEYEAKKDCRNYIHASECGLLNERILMLINEVRKLSHLVDQWDDSGYTIIEKKGSKNAAEELLIEFKKLKEREAAFRAVLEFYSNRYHWNDIKKWRESKFHIECYTSIDLDMGDKAREVLARYPEAKEKE